MTAHRPSTFQWLAHGAAGYVAMWEAIEQARESVRLETYIYANCPAGERFRDALVAAQARGARVRVLVDAFGSLTLPTSFWEPLMALGGQFRWFNPLSLRRWTYRNHRKLLVCDDAVAFVGGFNIAPEYEGDGVTTGWRDLGLRIAGPLVHELAESFDLMFERADFRHKRLQRLRKARIRVTHGRDWQLLTSGPGSRHGQIKRTLARDLARARSVHMMSGYFLPTWRLRNELRGVSRRGGRVQLLLSSKSDVPFMLLASRRLYRPFLRAGVEIFEYQPQILHAKLFVIDDIVYVGSANLDTRSLGINYELLVRIEDAQLATEARAIFTADLQQARRIDRRTWRRTRSFWYKLKERWAYFVLARLDPLVARMQIKALR